MMTAAAELVLYLWMRAEVEGRIKRKVGAADGAIDQTEQFEAHISW